MREREYVSNPSSRTNVSARADEGVSRCVRRAEFDTCLETEPNATVCCKRNEVSDNLQDLFKTSSYLITV